MKPLEFANIMASLDAIGTMTRGEEYFAVFKRYLEVRIKIALQENAVEESVKSDLDVLCTVIRTGFIPPDSHQWTDEIYENAVIRVLDMTRESNINAAATRELTKALGYGILPHRKDGESQLVELAKEVGERINNGGWRPMSEAPNDKRILLKCRTGLIYIGQYRSGKMSEPQESVFAWRCDSSGRYSEPIGWKHVPD